MRDYFSRFWFIGALLVAVVMGLLFPHTGQILNPESVTTTTIVVLVFINLGLALPFETLGRGILQPRLHLFIQVFIFVIVPVYFYATVFLVRPILTPELIAGIYALSCLPTTISSCVVLTQRAGGNAVAATFNASLSNAIGIVLTPLLLFVLLRGSGVAPTTSSIPGLFRNLLFQMIIPFSIGLGLQHISGIRIRSIRRYIDEFNSFLITLIVFFAIANAAMNPSFRRHLNLLPLPLLYLAISHLVLVFTAFSLGKVLKFEKDNLITALFVAPQKTIALGVPLLTAVFSGNEQLLGIAYLPLLFYHPWQVLVGAVLSQTAFFSIKKT